MGNGDNFALDWIRGELESTLDQARAALESYAEGGREETRLRSCLTSLHQVHGTLRMLELEGVVLLADHMEQTAQSLLNGSIKDARSAEQSLMQSILQLPAFIEEVQNGVTEDLPLVMPFVNELRACCGLSAMQLTPQVSSEFTSEQADEVVHRFQGINGADKAARVRAAYQQVLLSVLKGGASAQTVETLGKIAIGMQRICEGAPLATLWKALEHYARGYASDPQKMSSEAIRDLRRVDAEMKKVVTDGADALLAPLPVELVRDLLRAAEARGERDEQITELRSAVQVPQAAQMKPREALDQAADVLAEEIASVRDRFDLFARGDQHQLDELKELSAPLEQICSTLSMLGDDHGATLLREQREQILALSDNSEITEDVILAFAGSLVQTEQALTGKGEIASSDQALASAALNEAQMAVLQEARGGIDQVKQSIVDFVSSKWNAGYLEASPNVLAAVQGALTMIPLPRAADLLASCSQYISDELLQGHHPDWQELDAFADALGGIDYFLERLFETGRVPGDDALNLTEESLARLAGATSGGVDNESAESVDSSESAVAADASSSDASEPESSTGGDTALTAMLGARPEELTFVADDAPAEELSDSGSALEDEAQSAELDELALDASDSDAAVEPSAMDEASELTLDSSLELVGLDDDAADSAGEEADDAAGEAQLERTPELATEAAESGADDLDLSQTAFLDASQSEPVDDSPSTLDAGTAATAAGTAAAAVGLGSIASLSDTETPLTLVDDTFEDTPDADTNDAKDASGSDGSGDGSGIDENESAEATAEIPPVDPEIVEIFVEEVDEVLESIEAHLPDWSEDLLSVSPITEIRRSFHTLKGSGRIVGANQIGELGWAIENMLNRLLDGTITPSEDHLFVVSHACTIVPAMRADFAQGVSVERPELIELLEQVDVLASGGALSSALASAAPVMDEPGESADDELPVWDDTGFAESDRAADAHANSDETRPPSVDVPEFLIGEDPSAADAATLDQDAEDTRSLFAEELQEHLDVLSERIRNSLADDQLELDSSITRALHTIAGSAATAGEFGVVGIAEPMQDVASAVLRERGGVLDGEYLAFVREGVYALQRLLDVDAPDSDHSDDSALFGAEAERLLGGLLEAPDASTSLLEMDDTAVLLDAREYLDGWRFGTMDLERAEQMNRALVTVIERAHSDDFAELAEILHLAHAQFADQPLDEDRHFALVAGHDDLLVQLDALAAGQVATMSMDSRERLQDLISAGPAPSETDTDLDNAGSVEDALQSAAFEIDELQGELAEDTSDADLLFGDVDSASSDAEASSVDEPEQQTGSMAVESADVDLDELDEDAQEALAYELDDSDAFDLNALDDDMFASDDQVAEPVAELQEEPLELSAEQPQEQLPEQPEEQLQQEPETSSFEALAAGAGLVAGAALFANNDSDASPSAPEDVVSEEASAAAEDDDEIDPELLEIFFEEADEILEEFDHNVQDWSVDRAIGAPLDNLLRGLHTLKGGARLAGMTQLGDMTHDYESELIDLQTRGADLTDAQLEDVQQRYDDLVEAVSRARSNDPAPEFSGNETAPEAAAPEISDSTLAERSEPTTVVDASAASDFIELPELTEDVDVSIPVDAMDTEASETSEVVDVSDSAPDALALDDVAAVEDVTELPTETERRIDAQESKEPLVSDDFSSDVEAAFSAESLAALDAADDASNAVAASDESITDNPKIPAPPAFRAPEPSTSAEAQPSSEEDRSRTSQEMVRVSASLLEDLVNLAGETSIVRARVEQGISDFGSALEEMETTIERVREQLRQLEIETETRVSSRVERSQGPAYEEFDPLEMDRYSQLQQLTRSLTESATDMMDLKETLRYRARESETLLLQQARLNTELQEGLMRTRMVPFSRLMPRLRRIVRQVSRDLGKQVEFQAYNAEGELDRNVLERMVPPLEHMLRNAIDHGIESEDLRHSFGKPTIGRIGLKLSREGGDVVIEISDDGAGIDVETVRAKAVERGLMSPDAVLTDDQVLDFVLAPGFSTAKSLTQISGRGVGMDVVHSEVKQLGGSIEIGSVPGRGTTFTVRLPFTVSVNRALMVSLGDDQYAIPLNTIEGIVLLPSDELSQHYGPQGTPFEYAGVPYRVRYLGSYLGREYVSRSEQTSVPVVLVRSGDQAVAVHVDDVQGSREIVVKSLGPQFAGVGGISGATILGDGSVVIILDLLSLMRARGPGNNVESRQPASVEEERWVLVVDDSVTVRKVTSRLLERQGMNVITAKDGVEAVSVLQERLPDIVLLDIEMPRMDGFEVARQVRRDDRLCELPIVMISSRTGAKHTERARELGVNRFLGKPFQENELLEVIDELVTRS